VFKLNLQNGLKQGSALSPLLFYFVFQHGIVKFQEYRVGLKLNGTHQLLAYEYADHANLLRDNIYIIKIYPETFIDARKEVER
jgi:hypothetical protein